MPWGLIPYVVLEIDVTWEEIFFLPPISFDVIAPSPSPLPEILPAKKEMVFSPPPSGFALFSLQPSIGGL